MRKPATEETNRKLVRVEIPAAVKVMGEMASNPAIKPAVRLWAVELLLRVGTTDHRASTDAKTYLYRAVPLLEQLIRSRSSARAISRATRLARQIATLSRD